MKDVILVLNCGSSSIKFQVFEHNDDLELLTKGRITGIGSKPQFSIEGGETKDLPEELTQNTALDTVIGWIDTNDDGWNLIAVGHRVVHGGEAYIQPVLVDDKVLHDLRNLIPLAPMHMPYNIAGMETVHEVYPHVRQIACFDTAFHTTIDPLHKAYALPTHLREAGIHKYGFHGLSYEWISQRLKRDDPDISRGKVIVAHLGNGASLCAMLDGVSIDTTMGMTALEGLPMGTRSGSIDPGAVLYMIRQMSLSPERVEEILSRQSGLLGLSGISNDVRELRNSQKDEAVFALNYFAYKVAQNIAALSASMSGLDGVVFTGGIGENDAQLRDQITAQLEHLKPFKTCVIATDEERMIATHVQTCFAKEKEKPHEKKFNDNLPERSDKSRFAGRLHLWSRLYTAAL